MAVTLQLATQLRSSAALSSLRSMPFTITRIARKKRLGICGSGWASSHKVQCIWSAEIKGIIYCIFDTLYPMYFWSLLCVQTMGLIAAVYIGWSDVASYVWGRFIGSDKSIYSSYKPIKRKSLSGIQSSFTWGLSRTSNSNALLLCITFI